MTAYSCCCIVSSPITVWLSLSSADINLQTTSSTCRLDAGKVKMLVLSDCFLVSCVSAFDTVFVFCLLQTCQLLTKFSLPSKLLDQPIIVITNFNARTNNAIFRQELASFTIPHYTPLLQNWTASPSISPISTVRLLFYVDDDAATSNSVSEIMSELLTTQLGFNANELDKHNQLQLFTSAVYQEGLRFEMQLMEERSSKWHTG